MGLFHCPMGALYRDDDPCIDCGLCDARTREELIKASKKIRSHLKFLAPKNTSVQKIAVCGKGGVGKSTISTLMGNVMASQGYTTLLIDTDESNPGLARMLGLSVEPRPLIKLLKRFSDKETDAENGWLCKNEISLSDIPAEFLSEKENLKFLMLGKITDPFEGCACNMAGLIRDLLKKIVLKENEKVIIDTEAGVESFGRGIERSVDTVLIIVEPSFESIGLAEKINYMAGGIGVRTVRAILNKTPSKKIENKIKERLSKLKIKSIGSVSFDLKVNEDAFEGKPLEKSRAEEDINSIMKILLDLNHQESTT